MVEKMSFIEKQFPVSKVSKESYKERKASQGQTITGLGKWWGRKPLILIRAAILGCIMPCSDNPKADMEIFLKILSMDNDGLLDRKQNPLSVKALYEIAQSNKHFKQYISDWFEVDGENVNILDGQDKHDIETRLFKTLGYDEKIKYCVRPEQLTALRSDSWNAINHYLGTNARSLTEVIEQLSIKRFGRLITVGDCFSGGGSIPFESARMGFNTYASDLNPIAGLLTWADLNICGATEDQLEQILSFQKKAYDAVDKEICDLGIEHNEHGDRALSYLYCVEANCPECGCLVPLLPSLVVGIRAGKVVAELHDKVEAFDISIKSGVSEAEIKKAKENGTVRNNSLICPHCGKSTPISVVRRDRFDVSGNKISGLRIWEKEDFEPRKDDVYHERLYAIRYEHIEVLPSGKTKSSRYYCAPSCRDIENEELVRSIVNKNFASWQDTGLIPSTIIESGYNTDQIIRERGWAYWHQLFNARQLFVLSQFAKQIHEAPTQLEKVVGILGLNKCADFGSKLCRWNPNRDIVAQTFYNQALNTLMNYGISGIRMLNTAWKYDIKTVSYNPNCEVKLADARIVSTTSDIWITDPPYADAVNYHELSEFFLAWDKRLLQEAFPDWYTDSKRILAVRGDDHFSETMIEIYTNLTNHMPDDGMQVVMFTHSDPAVWAQLALIMWKSGLRVTAAWNIATETDASGLKDGNYVKGTVLLILRKQTGDDMAFLDEINSDIRAEVKNQIASMLELENKEEPNFSDPDFVLAAYAASLKVLTSYKTIEDLDLDYELNLAINKPAQSSIVKIIETAKKIAYDCVIPLDFESYLWKDLTNAEKFYIKGLESEKHGNYQISTYQEFARGFNIGGYGQMMASEKANTARLKTPFEMAGRTLNDIPDFERSLLRTIFMGIYTGIKEDENPSKAIGYIKNELSNYWEKRDMIKQLLSFIKDTKDIDNMVSHWNQSASMAELLYSLVLNDNI